MKILYCITKSEIGGAQIHLLSLLKSFRSKYDISLLTGDYGFLEENTKKLDIPVHIINNLSKPISLINDFSIFLNCYKHIQKIQPDIIHTHTAKISLIIRISAFIQRIPVLYTVHGWPFLRGTTLERKIISIPIEFFAKFITKKIITVSIFDQDLAKKYLFYTSKKVHYIPNGIEDITPKQKILKSSNKVQLITIARMSPQKDYSTLLKSLVYVLNKKPRVVIELVIIGNGVNENQIKDLVKNLKLENNITFLGNITNVKKHLDQSNIFILSSNWEGLPISIIEAMRSELPIIATNVGGISEMIPKEENGFLIEHQNYKQMGEAIYCLANNQEQRVQMGKKSRELFLKNFEKSKMLNKTNLIYQDLSKH